MKQSKKIAKLLGVFLLAASSTVYGAPAEPLQNSQQAVDFFTHELEFKTNPHGVKAVVDGKIKNVTIVDLRTANDFAKGHIPGAVNVPWDQHKSFDGDEREEYSAAGHHKP